MSEPDGQWTTLTTGPTAWTLDRSRATSRAVVIAYRTLAEQGTHEAVRVRDRLDDIRVVESDRSVAIGVSQTIDARGDVAFISVDLAVTVMLAEPLGARLVEHLPVPDQRDSVVGAESPA